MLYARQGLKRERETPDFLESDNLLENVVENVYQIHIHDILRVCFYRNFSFLVL